MLPLEYYMKKFALKYFFIYFILFYRFFISPFFSASCRFYPTCSLFATYAIEKHGLLRGGQMALRRLLRCHPFSRRAGYDPLP